MSQDYYTSEQAATLLNRPVRTIRMWAQQGRFPGAWLPSPRSSWLIPREVVDGFTAPKRGRPRKPPDSAG